MDALVGINIYLCKVYIYMHLPHAVRVINTDIPVRAVKSCQKTNTCKRGIHSRVTV